MGPGSMCSCSRLVMNAMQIFKHLPEIAIIVTQGEDSPFAKESYPSAYPVFECPFTGLVCFGSGHWIAM